MRRPLLFLLLALLWALPALGDVLVLDDGRRIEGTIVKETSKEVVIDSKFGTLTFSRDQIVDIERGKTRDQIYEEKLAAAKTADDFFALGEWCEAHKLRRRGEKHFKKAVELDPDHAGARRKLGFVRYKDEWLTPAERDARQKADFEAEMKAKGLVRHGEQWVTPEEKAKLEQGLVLHEGRWLPEAEAMLLRGMAEYGGQWIEAHRALGLRAAEGFAAEAAFPIQHHLGDQAVLIGALGTDEMAAIDAGLTKARAWYDAAFKQKPGLGLFGGQLAEFYVFGDGAREEYDRSATWVQDRSRHVPEGWATAVRRTYGFTWLDPVPVSSARKANRDFIDLAGHCYHHMGHLMAGRDGYDGKLLPPWYEEAVAGLAELNAHGTNLVFCRSSFVGGFEGSQSGAGDDSLDEDAMRGSEWRVLLRRALERGQVKPFDKLAQLEFSQLDLLDIAQSMVLLEWIQSRGEEALQRFHRELRRAAPPAPERVIRTGHLRHEAYERAFQAAVGMGFRQADSEWRRWFLNR